MAKEFKIPVKEVVLSVETYNELEEKLESAEMFKEKITRFFENLTKSNVRVHEDILDFTEIHINTSGLHGEVLISGR